MSLFYIRRNIGEGATLKAGTAPLKLPDAYRSSATHFTPIVLTNHEKKTSPARSSAATSPSKVDRASRNIKELKKQLLKKHNVQEGEAKLSPRQPDNSDLSPVSTPNNPSTRPEIPETTADSRPTLTTKPVPATKPSISQIKDRGGASTPVTQAVRPLPRNSGIIQNTKQQVSASMENLNNSNNRSSAVANISSSMHNLAQPSSVQITEPVQTLPAVTNTQTNHAQTNHAQTNHSTQQPLVVNGATISTPPMISSYPSVPVVLQRDPTTGAMSWIPVVHNMPYWSMSPQQAPAPAVIQPVTAQAPVNTPQQQTTTPQHNQTVHSAVTSPLIATTASQQGTQGDNTTDTITQLSQPQADTLSQQSTTRLSQNGHQQSAPPKPVRERKPRSKSN